VTFEMRAAWTVWTGVASLWLVAGCTRHNNIGTQALGGSGPPSDAGQTGDAGSPTGAAGAGGSGAVTVGGAGGGPSGGGGAPASAGGAGGSLAVSEADVGPAFFISGCPLWPVAASAPPPAEVHLGTDGVVRADQHDCAYTSSAPVALPLEPGDGGSLLFHYDVNGDGVDDLFFGESSVDAGATRHALVVLQSTLQPRAAGQGQSLSFTRAACTDTGPAYPYRVFFLRDLNRDGVPDFVVATGTTIDAWLNLDGKRRGVLHHELPNPGGAWSALLDVLVGDFDDDGTDDVVMGYDRNEGFVGNIETGALLFRGRPGRGTYETPTALAVSALGPQVVAGSRGVQSGYLATVPVAPRGVAVFGLTWSDPGIVGWLSHGSSFDLVASLFPSAEQPGFARVTQAGGASALVVGSETTIGLFDLASTVPQGFLTHPASFTHSYDRELGGGPRYRTYYLLDADGDGDDDLVELDRVGGHQLAVHPQLGSVAFGAPTRVDVGVFSIGLVESPFVPIGKMQGRLLVGDGAPDDLAASPATVRAMLCPN
jgi:hypothetical protein